MTILYSSFLKAFVKNFLNLIMIVTIKNVDGFTLAIKDYVMDKYDLFLKDLNVNEFLILDEINKKYTNTSFQYTRNENILQTFCDKKILHIHQNKSDIFCSQPEKFALLYLHKSLFSYDKYDIISSLKLWLADVVMEYVHVDCSSNIVVSDLYPSFGKHFLNSETQFDTLKYYYYSKNITSDNYILTLNKKKLIILENQHGENA